MILKFRLRPDGIKVRTNSAIKEGETSPIGGLTGFSAFQV
jgi:hypothetical protein